MSRSKTDRATPSLVETAEVRAARVATIHSGLRDRYRYDIQLVFSAATALMSAIDLFKSEAALKAKVKTLTVDVDPVSLQ